MTRTEYENTLKLEAENARLRSALKLAREQFDEVERRLSPPSASEPSAPDVHDAGFATEDYRELADSLRREKDNSVLLHTIFSNNFNVILGALDNATSASERSISTRNLEAENARLRAAWKIAEPFLPPLAYRRALAALESPSDSESSAPDILSGWRDGEDERRKFWNMSEQSAPFGFRLKVYPNPMRDDGVFVAEDKPIEPYPPPNENWHPAIPNTPYSLGMQLPHEFAKEIVRRWNEASPSASKKRVARDLEAENTRLREVLRVARVYVAVAEKNDWTGFLDEIDAALASPSEQSASPRNLEAENAKLRRAVDAALSGEEGDQAAVKIENTRLRHLLKKSQNAVEWVADKHGKNEPAWIRLATDIAAALSPPSASEQSTEIGTFDEPRLAALTASATEEAKRNTYTWLSPSVVLELIRNLRAARFERDAALSPPSASEPQPVVGSPDAWRG